MNENNGGDPAAFFGDVRDQVDQVNADFQPHRIQFVWDMQSIRDSRYRTLEDAGEIDAMKDRYASMPETNCNVFVSDLPDYAGVGTFPWDPDARTARGGIVVDEAFFGTGQHTLTHLIGHSLGLYHTHAGVDDEQDSDPNTRLDCGHPCREVVGGGFGDERGDFCSDTPPTPLNFTCSDPNGIDECSGLPWGATQPENYMSDAPDSCRSLFTNQQAGRMHCWIEERLTCWLNWPVDLQKITAPDVYQNGRFANSVSLSGNTALIGMSSIRTAYVFRETGGVWKQIARLRPSGGVPDDGFGSPVSLAGDTALIGAPFDDIPGASSGSAYVFRKVGGVWTQIAKLTPSDGVAYNKFGRSLSLEGDTALVGAPLDDAQGLDSGSAYVFREVGDAWTQIAKLTASDGSAADEFGWSVSLAGDTALIGARRDDDLAFNSGSAYVFREVEGVWTQIAKLTASDGAARYGFGSSVSLAGDTALIGRRKEDDPTNSAGAYVFREVGSQWRQIAKLTFGIPSAGFGRPVSLAGDTALVGAVNDDGPGGTATGSVYVYREVAGVWTSIGLLRASDGAAFDQFGTSLSLAGDTALIGVPFDGGFTPARRMSSRSDNVHWTVSAMTPTATPRATPMTSAQALTTTWTPMVTVYRTVATCARVPFLAQRWAATDVRR